MVERRKNKMNKLFTKVAALSVGLAMAVGVGVAVGSKSVRKASATSYSVAYTLDCSSASANGSQDEYGVGKTGVMAASGIRAFLVKANGGTDIFTETGVDGVSGSIYWSKGSGAESVPSDCLKVGKASDAGAFSMHLSSSAKSISKVSITGYCWKTTSAVSVNGSEAQKAATAQTEVTFDYVLSSATKDISLSSTTSAICITTIKLYEEASAVSPTSISCENQTIIETDSINLANLVVFTPSTTTETGLSFAIASGSDKIELGAGTGLVTGVSAGTAVVTITPNDTSEGAVPINVTITVTPLEISSIESSGTEKTDFVEEQPLSFGSLKVKVVYNNGSSKNVNIDDEGVSVTLGGEAISGTRYLSLLDNGKTVRVSYAGFYFEYQISVTEKGETQEGYWTKITDVADFVAGLEVIIVGSENNYAMGASTGGNNVPGVEISKDSNGNIDTLVAGVKVYTLVDSSSVTTGTFALYDGEYYLAATGGSNNNHLKRQSSIDDKACFTFTTNGLSVEAVSRGVARSNPNNGNPIFACYASTSTTGCLAVAYKFVSQSKSADQEAVETFCKVSLHLDSKSEDYIDFNDNTSGTACLSYYQTAKTAYGSLTAEQKEIFATSAEFIIARGRDRFAAWAAANGEEFDAANGTFTAINYGFELGTAENSTMTIIIITVSAISVLAFTTLLVFKKKKQK